MRLGQPDQNGVSDGWRDAMSVSKGQPSALAEQHQRASRNRRTALLIGVGLLPLTIVAGLLAAGGSLPELARAERPDVLQNAGLALSAIGLLLSILGAVRSIRAGMWGQAWRAPELSLSRPERRKLLDQIRRGEPVADERRPVAMDLAQRLSRQLPLVLLFGGVVVNGVGQTLGSSAVPLQWLSAALVIPGLALVLVMRHDVVRGRRWLERYGSDATSV